MSSGATGHEALFDAAAESLILIDPTDAESVAELVERLVTIAEWFGDDAGEDHPVHACVEAARRVERGDASALSALETEFGAARAEADRRARGARTTEAAPAAADAATASRRARKRSAAPAAPTADAAAADAAPAADAPGAMPLAGDDELLRDFAVRAIEHLDDADEQLLGLEADLADRDAIDAVFRAFHTIKGMAGFLALDAISLHAHGSESLLADARSNGTELTSDAVQGLFVAVDKMRILVAEATGVGNAPVEGDAAGAAPATDGETVSAGAKAERGESNAASARAGTVRVEEARLDSLLDAIGELVIAESMASAAVRTGEDVAAVGLQVDRLDKITRELQQMATSLRMVPLRATFRRMARVVRDTATKAGKEVELVLVGEDTELDKTVVDRIADPLIHALRNAVDHGIETAEERVAAGKPAVGCVELRAYHAGGAIHVEIADDGRGIDPARVLATARKRGLIGADETPDDRAILDLVLAPGFSTAEEITDVSGRGVGMDVVKRTVEELRGHLTLASRPGEGTTIEIRLPLTLAIIDGMILRVADDRYVLPLLSIERSVRPTAEQVISVAGRGEMLSLDDGLVPIIRLHELFGIDGALTDPTQAVVVIVNGSGTTTSRAGLLACELLGQQQTVIKPLGEGLPQQAGIAGGAIMPDGRVGLILDATGLVKSIQNTGGE